MVFYQSVHLIIFILSCKVVSVYKTCLANVAMEEPRREITMFNPSQQASSSSSYQLQEAVRQFLTTPKVNKHFWVQSGLNQK